MFITILLVVAALWLGFANGANDNMKGVATLLGSRTARYKQAFILATSTTLLGSITSVFLADTLIKNFSGKGLVPDAIVASPAFLIAVGIGAAITVLLATRMGIPISTTHALTGALAGAGLLAAASELQFAALGEKFMLPLLVSPVLAVVATMLIYPLFRFVRERAGISRETCVCIGEEYHVVPLGQTPEQVMAMSATSLTATVGTTAECVERYQGKVLGVSAQTIIDRLHFLSAGAVCFARGLNDTPKIAALLITAGVFEFPKEVTLAGIGVVIALGGLASRRVALTMSNDITTMNHGQGFTGNLVTAFLVIVASRMGLPVSTTHVSCGALFGMGAVTRQARWATIGKILLAWVTTLPLAAALAAIVYLLVS